MNTIDYFKLQAKNLHRDFKTKTLDFDKNLNRFTYVYFPKYFAIEAIVHDFEIEEEKLYPNERTTYNRQYSRL